MKFVSLRTKRARRSIKLDKRSGASHQRFATATGEHRQIHTYTDLRQQIHDDLRIQHPEWVQPDGKSPKCDSVRGAPHGIARWSNAKRIHPVHC